MIEIATFLGSYVLSFISTSISALMKIRSQQHHQLMQLAGLREQSTISARVDIKDKHTKTTRRILAIGAFFSLILFILYMSSVGTPIYVEETKITGGWFIFPEREVTEFIKLDGIPFIKEYKLILLSVYGLYFGNNHAR